MTDVRRAEEWMAVVDRFVGLERLAAGVDDLSAALRRHPGCGRPLAGGRRTNCWRRSGSPKRSYRILRTFPIVRLADLRAAAGTVRGSGTAARGFGMAPDCPAVLAAAALGRRELDLAYELATLCLESVAPVTPRVHRCWACWSTSTWPETIWSRLTTPAPSSRGWPSAETRWCAPGRRSPAGRIELARADPGARAGPADCGRTIHRPGVAARGGAGEAEPRRAIASDTRGGGCQ